MKTTITIEDGRIIVEVDDGTARDVVRQSVNIGDPSAIVEAAKLPPVTTDPPPCGPPGGT